MEEEILGYSLSNFQKFQVFFSLCCFLKYTHTHTHSRTHTYREIHTNTQARKEGKKYLAISCDEG